MSRLLCAICVKSWPLLSLSSTAALALVPAAVLTLISSLQPLPTAISTRLLFLLLLRL
jgi:hypothetical protein